jgi:Na+-transporting NADH:ubiquinone oxidoreductase subunit C
MTGPGQSGRPESFTRTLLFALAVALVCSLIVSTAVYLLRPRALAYEAMDLNRAVLEALGTPGSGPTASDREVIADFLALDTRIVDFSTDTFTSAVDPAAYDFRRAVEDPAELTAIAEADDVAGIGERPRYAPVYIRLGDSGVERIALPLYARGMWSTIHAIVALENDYSTIAGVVFYAHGETPGIGDRIEAPAWRSQWAGKRIYGPDGDLRFRIGRQTAEQAPAYGVDAITGATVTTTAIGEAMQYWFSEDGYAPLLRRLRDEGI